MTIPTPSHALLNALQVLIPIRLQDAQTKGSPPPLTPTPTIALTSNDCDPICSIDDMTSEEYEEVADNQKSDIIKAVVIGTGLSVVAALINLDWVTTHQVGLAHHSSGHTGLPQIEVGLGYHTSMQLVCHTLNGNRRVITHGLKNACMDSIALSTLGKKKADTWEFWNEILHPSMSLFDGVLASVSYILSIPCFRTSPWQLYSSWATAALCLKSRSSSTRRVWACCWQWPCGSFAPSV